MKMFKFLEGISDAAAQSFVANDFPITRLPESALYLISYGIPPKICFWSSCIIDFTGMMVTSMIPRVEFLKS